jgi:hypothetical protein
MLASNPRPNRCPDRISDRGSVLPAHILQQIVGFGVHFTLMTLRQYQANQPQNSHPYKRAPCYLTLFQGSAGGGLSGMLLSARL